MCLTPLSLLSILGLTYAALCQPAVKSCANIPKPHVEGAEVISITGEKTQSTLSDQIVCEINVTLSHTGAYDTVLVQTWLPLDDWNGRFVALGGGGWVAGVGAEGLAVPVSQGYVAASTDAGLPGGDATSPSLWALDADGKINYDLLENFASRSVHDLAVVGKAVTESFYGHPANHAFWNGCSTGGRQGLAAAQKYPEDFDGILAGAPGHYWTEFLVATLWPQVVMRDVGYYPPTCVLDAIVNAAIRSCDTDDGVEDGVISEPFECNFDPSQIVGTRVTCEDGDAEITEKAVTVVRRIWDGPIIGGKKLWHGMVVGASLNILAASEDVNGTTVGIPFFAADAWVRYYVKENPEFDTGNIDAEGFASLFEESKAQFDSIIGASDPDLSRFIEAGGKLLLWHGLADQTVFPQSSVQYFNEVQRTVGATDDTFRLFLAPGVDHCGEGLASIIPGAVPKDPFGDLVAWVESGEAPDAIEAETRQSSESQFTRKICAFPRVARLRGGGDADDAENYECAL